jgi:hypothetical protein
VASGANVQWHGLAAIFAKSARAVLLRSSACSIAVSNIWSLKGLLRNSTNSSLIAFHRHRRAGDHELVKALVYVAAIAPSAGQQLRNSGKDYPTPQD